tara:strand:- start:1942 stop:2883 length:942 start_codon:yes stop_codon:yes gene_type:complete
MPKFFQVEKAAYSGEKNTFTNVKFKKRALDNSSAAEAGTILEIIPLHIKNPPVIQFMAYITGLRDNFKSSQKGEQPFGRPDKYYMWQGNNRSISVTFDIPSSSAAKGLDNLNNLSWFLGALYPTYKDNQTATSIAASPMFRVRFANLICSSTNDGQGLPGVIQSINVTHDHSQGFIGINTQNMGTSFADAASSALKAAGFDTSINEGKKFLIPKLMKINFTLDVVHDHQMGWDYHTGQWRGGMGAPRFPYDFGMLRDTTDSPSAGATVSADVTSVDSSIPGTPNARNTETVLDDKLSKKSARVDESTGDVIKL